MPSWWPFGRRPEADQRTAGPGPVPAPVVRTDWMRLPPIQRAIADHPMTAPADLFNDRLVTHQDPTVLARSLGHEVTTEAPRGIVVGAVHIRERSDGPEMAPRPRRQRRPEAAGEPEAIEWPSDPTPQALPLLHLPVSEVAAASSPTASLTQLSAESEPLPLESRARPERPPAAPRRESFTPPQESRRPEPGVATQTTPSKLTLGQSRRLGLGAPMTQVPEPSLQRAPANLPSLTLKPPGPVTKEAPVPVAPLPSPGEASVVKVDSGQPPAPAADTIATPPIQRAPATSLIEAPLTSERPLSTTQPGHSTPGPSDGASDSSSAVSLPLAPPVQRAATPSSPAEGAEVSTSTPPPGHDVASRLVEKASGQAAMSPAAITIAPLLAERPLRATTAVQRSAEPVPARVQEEMRQALGMDVSSARVHRGGDAAGAAAAVQARAFTQGDDVYLPATHGPLESGPARSLLAHELTHVAQQRRLGSSLPGEASPAGQQLEAEARGMESVWQGSSPMTLAPRTQSAPAAAQAASAGALEMAQAAARDLVSAGRASQAPDGSLIFRAPESVAPSAPSPTSASSATVQRQPAPAAAPPASHVPTPTSDADLEELARKLYEPIRARLRTELLVDRERAGMIADIR